LAQWRRRTRPTEIKLTPEGWVFLIVLGFITVGAVLRNVNLLIAMAGMLFAPLLMNWRLGVRRLKSFHAFRRLPKRINANELTRILWTCENRLPGVAAWNVIISDRVEQACETDQEMLQGEAGGSENRKRSSGNRIKRWLGEIFRRLRQRTFPPSQSDVRMAFVRIDAGQSEVQAYRVFFAVRGEYTVGPAAISTTFPFGLIVSRLHFRKTETLFVGPEIGQLQPTWERRVQSVASGSDSLMRRRTLDECEFYALRPWRSGDSKRNIHWRTSAKLGQPIVKQHDQPNNRDFALMLDLYSDGRDKKFDARSEQALSFAATAIRQMGSAVQGQLAVGICGLETETCLSRSQQKMQSDLSRRLAVAQTTDQPRLSETLIQLAGLVSRGTPIYVISSRPRPEQFKLSSIQANSGSQEQDRLTRSLRPVLRNVRWLEVDSEEFRSLFTIERNADRESDLKQLASRWVKDVKR
jgi:hypothetical protein